MTRNYFTLLLWSLLACTGLAQEYRFAWFTDTHIGSPTGETDLQRCVESVNADRSLAFVIVTGDITEKGKNAELERAKAILDQLHAKYYIFPGNHDTKWSESFCTKFKQLWGDDKFVFDYNQTRHIGLNSGILWRGGGGHITPEDLKWLDSVVTATGDTQPILLYTHHPLDGDIDNWFKVINTIRKKNIQTLFYGHGHVNRIDSVRGIPSIQSRSTLTAKKGWGYSICRAREDSLFVSELRNDTLFSPWTAVSINKRRGIPAVDSTQYIDSIGLLLWKRDLGATFSAAPLAYGDTLITASANGCLTCFDGNGVQLWKINLRGHICSQPVARDGILVAATHEGEVMTIEIATGRIIQSIGIEEPITSQLQITPATYKDEDTYGVLIGTATGKMLCYDMYFLEQIWENTAAKAMIETKPAVANGRVFYGSWDGYFYCVDASTGALNWKWTDKANFYYSPAAHYPVTDSAFVYIATPDNYITKIDMLLGIPAYRVKTVKAWESIGISADKKNLFIKEVNNHFSVCDAATGALLRQYDLRFGTDTTPIEMVESGGRVVFGTREGNIHLYSGSEVPTILNIGTARILSIASLGGGKFAALNMDGKLVVFKLP